METGIGRRDGHPGRQQAAPAGHGVGRALRQFLHEVVAGLPSRESGHQADAGFVRGHGPQGRSQVGDQAGQVRRGAIAPDHRRQSQVMQTQSRRSRRAQAFGCPGTTGVEGHQVALLPGQKIQHTIAVVHRFRPRRQVSADEMAETQTRIGCLDRHRQGVAQDVALIVAEHQVGHGSGLMRGQDQALEAGLNLRRRFDLRRGAGGTQPSGTARRHQQHRGGAHAQQGRNGPQAQVRDASAGQHGLMQMEDGVLAQFGSDLGPDLFRRRTDGGQIRRNALIEGWLRRSLEWSRLCSDRRSQWMR